jgi:SAM-dependent methyltransferase
MYRRPGVARVTVFGANYADCYDILYRTKDYSGEVDLVERLLAKSGAAGPRDILDLGCGTGNHALPLAERGHRVTGVDRSAGMLAQARAKAATLPLAHTPVFIEGDVCRLDLGRHFDAALMMFMVLGYQHENADLVAALAGLRRHLAPAGLFVFDVWNGLAVLAQRPGERTVEATHGDTTIVRRTRTRLEPMAQLCHVHFDIERTDAGGTTAWEETHTVRFFFPQELDLVLRCNGMRLLQLSSFPDGKGLPDENAWNIIGVAQAT